jgi:HK97 family phage prohead protease
MPYTIVADHPDCDPGGFAVVDSSGGVVGCYATELDAEDAMKALMAQQNSATEAEDEGNPHDDAEAILELEIASDTPALELVRGAALPRAARATKIGREERRGSLELREDAAGGGSTVFGYASKFDSPYTVTDMFGEYEEVIHRGAFDRTIREQDVRLFVDHEGLALARSSVNLRLAEDQTGLYYEAALDPTVTVVSDLTKLMRAGIMRESSFAFQPVRQEWNADYTRRDIYEAKLYDVSVVSIPANPAASAGVRKALEAGEPIELELALRALFTTAELREGKVLSAANEKIVREAVDALSAMLASLEKAADGGSRDAGAMMIEKAFVEIARRRR